MYDLSKRALRSWKNEHTQKKKEMALTLGEAKKTYDSVAERLSKDGEEAFKQSVVECFTNLDVDRSGTLEDKEAVQLVWDLCQLMHFPPPTEQDVTAHFKQLDRNSDGKLSVEEVETGVRGALTYKLNGLSALIAAAQEKGLKDEDVLE